MMNDFDFLDDFFSFDNDGNLIKNASKLQDLARDVLTKTLKSACDIFKLSMPVSFRVNILYNFNKIYFTNNRVKIAQQIRNHLDDLLEKEINLYETAYNMSQQLFTFQNFIENEVRFNLIWDYGLIEWYEYKIAACITCQKKIFWYMWSSGCDLKLVRFKIQKHRNKISAIEYESNLNLNSSWCGICCKVLLFKLRNIKVHVRAMGYDHTEDIYQQIELT